MVIGLNGPKNNWWRLQKCRGPSHPDFPVKPGASAVQATELQALLVLEGGIQTGAETESGSGILLLSVFICGGCVCVWGAIPKPRSMHTHMHNSVHTGSGTVCVYSRYSVSI